MSIAEAVKWVPCATEKGNFVSIAGPSGSGQSTTLNMIGLLLSVGNWIAQVA